MEASKDARPERPVFATAKLRSIETVTFRLLLVPTAALPGWNRRVANWAEA